VSLRRYDTLNLDIGVRRDGTSER